MRYDLRRLRLAVLAVRDGIDDHEDRSMLEACREEAAPGNHGAASDAWLVAHMDGEAGNVGRLLATARYLATVHESRIGYWRSVIGDHVSAGLDALDGEDVAEGRAQLDRCCDVLPGAWGINALPNDVAAWQTACEAVLA